MSFLLLLLEQYPSFIGQVNDVWFAMHELPSGEKERAERLFISFVSMSFKSRGNIPHQRVKWELTRSYDDMKKFLDTFFEQLT
jgi:hypothetical protein